MKYPSQQGRPRQGLCLRGVAVVLRPAVRPAPGTPPPAADHRNLERRLGAPGRELRLCQRRRPAQGGLLVARSARRLLRLLSRARLEAVAAFAVGLAGALVDVGGGGLHAGALFAPRTLQDADQAVVAFVAGVFVDRALGPGELVLAAP